MLVSLRDILPKAAKERYAVGLFNTVNLEMAKGVLAAAEEMRSPVIIGTAEVLLPYTDLEELAYFLIPMARKASVPVVLHYDHGLTLERIRQAIDLGFSSVMYDCSTLNFDGNCKAVAALVKEAHSRGVSVEAELGHVGANETGAEAAGSDTSAYTEPEEARRFWELTGVDALAVAIGTAHGAYKAKPRLDFERLSEIARLVGAPLVLHGGSGLSDEDFRRTIERGIAKVNIFTDINCAAADAAHANWAAGKGLTDLMPAVCEAVRKAAVQKMTVFGSAGKA